MKISQKRQKVITSDAATIRRIYDAACQQWGQDKVDADHTCIWDLRCIWGMHRVLPFGAIECHNLGEVLWVVENVCGLVQTPRKVK